MPQPALTGPLCTQSTLEGALIGLGLQPGDTVLVHSSLRKLGYVCGGSNAVIEAFLSVLGPTGTLVVPTHTGENSDPKNWEAPPVPEEWWQTIRENAAPFDIKTSRTRGMGVIPETVRTWPGALRSEHPQTSFTAIGANAKVVTAGHKLDSMLGDGSPLARLKELDAKILLLGVGYDSCTAFHLAECRMPGSPRAPNSFAALVDGKRQWFTVEDLEVNSDDFEQLGADYEKHSGIAPGMVGGATSRLFPLREAVAFAEGWLVQHRAAKK